MCKKSILLKNIHIVQCTTYLAMTKMLLTSKYNKVGFGSLWRKLPWIDSPIMKIIASIVHDLYPYRTK